jgi:uncharacterized protein (TIRG00374 family)
MNMGRGGKYLQLLIAVVLAVGFLYLAFGKLDWAQFWKTLAEVRPEWIALACLLLVADYSVRVSRWWWMLRKTRPDVPWRVCFTPYLGCLALNIVLPFRAGDAVRVVAFRERLGVSSSTLLATVVAERIFDLGCLLVLLSVGLPFLPLTVIPTEWRTTVHSVSIALVAGCLVAIVANRPVRQLLGWLQTTGFAERHAFVRRPILYAEGVLDALKAIQSVGTIFTLLTLSLAAWLLEGGVFWCVATGLRISVAPIAAWLSMTLATLATLFPSTPGYIGPFHYFAKLGLTSFGVDDNRAAAFAFLVHAVLSLTPVIWGGYLLFMANVRRGQSSRGSSGTDN